MGLRDRVTGWQGRSLRVVFAAMLGRRLPTLDGSLDADVGAEVAIHRDGYGIPHIDAASDADAWYGLGFCYGQDRAFQMEMSLQVTRGTLAALIGKDGLPVDRLAPDRVPPGGAGAAPAA